MLLFLFLSASLFVSSFQQGFVPLVAQNYNERVNSALQQQVTSYIAQEIAYKYYAAYYDRADVDLPGFKHFFTSLSGEAAGHATKLITEINERGGRIRFPQIQLKDACDLIRSELNLGAITRPVNSESTTLAARRDPHICDFQLVSPKIALTKKESKYFGWFGKSKKGKGEEKEEKINRGPWQQGLYGLEDALAMERVVSSEIKTVLDLATALRDPLTRHRLEAYLADQVNSVYRVAELVKRLQLHQSLDTYLLQEYVLDKELKA